MPENVPAIAALERKAEPWSTYTEGWNDALDLAEQAAARELSRLGGEHRLIEEDYRRILWIIANQNGGRIQISEIEMTTVPQLPGIVVTTDASGFITVTALGTDHA